MIEYKKKKYIDIKSNKKFNSYILGIDIGGTNTNLGIAGIKNLKPYLLFSLNFKSFKLNSLEAAVKTILEYAKTNYDIDIEYACIGAAGVVSPSNDSAKLTNIDWDVSSNQLIKNTSLKSIYIINDFQAIGYGINLLDLKNINDFYPVRPINNQTINLKATKVIIGAGTGLGKSILTYDKTFNAYVPIQSEGGHSDFPVYNEIEMQLVDFIKKQRGIAQPLNYEELLSGRGIEILYHFLKKTQKYSISKFTEKIDKSLEKVPLIAQYRDVDETCKETFKMFTRFYGRCAKNFVLDSLARGGLYIAGGIAAKNKDIFLTKDFIDEFENAYRRNVFLKTVPINIIVNYDVSLYGACYAAMYKFNIKE